MFFFVIDDDDDDGCNGIIVSYNCECDVAISFFRSSNRRRKISEKKKCVHIIKNFEKEKNLGVFER